MQADLYIINDSFEQNARMSKEDVVNHLCQLSSDLDFIRTKHGDTNQIFVNSTVYDVLFYDRYSISDLVNNLELTKATLGREAYNALLSVITKSKQTSYTNQEIIEHFLPVHNQDLCCGVVAFNTIEGVDENQQIVIRTQKDWYKFRRHFLALYPQNGDFFISECTKYFPGLFFHERNKTTVAGILHDCSQKIIYHLAALNDKFSTCRQKNLNRTQVLKQFSIAAKLDEEATLEGNASRKSTLTFKFVNDKKVEEDVCCEPHLKLCYNDKTKSYSNDRRIYFHEGTPSIHEGRILIGHIGTHL